MKFTELPLKGAYVVEPKPFEDQRGMFSRIFCEIEFKEIYHSKKLVQINHSLTNRKGVVRGMHYQNPPMVEIKMVKCLRGSVYDVIIDLRRESDTLLKWHGEILSSKNRCMIYIPDGFAHGFQTLLNDSEVFYLVSHPYAAESEGGVRWDDPAFDIQWPLPISQFSAKDSGYPDF